MNHGSLFEFIKDIFMLKYIPQISNDAGLGILFILGLLTSLHCVGMCGGIALSQAVKSAKSDSQESSDHPVRTNKYQWILPSALYNVGRVISYTAVGGIIGGLGKIIGFTGIFKGLVPLIGGIFMIIMGINLLGVFPALRKFNIRMPYFIARKLTGNHNYGPFIVGLLTALMPCGPLQIAELYALGTRSVIAGASSMFIFSLGTVPLLFLFGAISSIANKKNTNVILKLSAAIVVVLGFVMLGRGLSLSGYSINIPLAAFSNKAADEGIAKIDGNVQTVTTSIKSGSFPEITVQKGIPVRWTIKASQEELNGCNNAITIPKLKMEVSFEVGDNIVEFTPDEVGEIPYTCWMGMIKSKINVVDHLKNTQKVDVKKEDNLKSTMKCDSMSNEDKITTCSASKVSADTEAAVSVAPKSVQVQNLSPNTEKKVSKPESASAEKQTLKRTIKISGMMCDMCVKHITTALSKIKGVEILSVEVGSAVVKVNKNVSNESITEAIKSGGYAVISITDN